MLAFQRRGSSSAPFRPAEVHQLSEEQLDALDLGVVALDAEGTVQGFNLCESRLSRLDRNQVVGRSFFREVARCTRGDEFEGRFRQLVSSGAAVVEPFEFLFDFEFGAQRVMVEMVGRPELDRYYLIIDTLEVLPPRPDVAPQAVAAIQHDLAPHEARHGVRRDAAEKRVVEVPWSFLAALRATCNELAPESWPLLCQEWGRHWGRRAAIDLEGTAREQGKASLRELSMRAFSELVSTHLRDQGWGHTTFDYAFSSEGLLSIELARSALAESTRAHHSPGAELPATETFACHLMAGCYGALLGHVAQKKITVREVSCALFATPDKEAVPRCRFVAVAHERRKLVDDALARGARDPEGLRAALRRPAGGAR